MIKADSRLEDLPKTHFKGLVAYLNRIPGTRR